MLSISPAQAHRDKTGRGSNKATTRAGRKVSPHTPGTAGQTTNGGETLVQVAPPAADEPEAPQQPVQDRPDAAEPVLTEVRTDDDLQAALVGWLADLDGSEIELSNGPAWDEAITRNWPAAAARCWPAEPVEVVVDGKVIGTVTFTPATKTSGSSRQQPRRAQPRPSGAPGYHQHFPATQVPSGRPRPARRDSVFALAGSRVQ